LVLAATLPPVFAVVFEFVFVLGIVVTKVEAVPFTSNDLCEVDSGLLVGLGLSVPGPNCVELTPVFGSASFVVFSGWVVFSG
jgi:hypothetical protein